MKRNYLLTIYDVFLHLIPCYKRTKNTCLMAAVVCGLVVCAASCTDDGGEDNDLNEQSAESQTGMSVLQDDQLRDLICQWCDVQKDELTGTAWKSQTFEPTVGFITDESAPYYRSIITGTLQEADRYAVQALSTLGIDGNNPNGFSYTDQEVGAVSYYHSTEPNILAVIDVEVKQLPHLVRLYLTGQGDENASGTPYYRSGDVIRYKGRYYVCASDHKYGEKALFVTFNDYNEHTTGTFNWRGVGEDVVYNDDMASPETLLAWFKNVFSSLNKRETLRGFLVDHGLDEEQISQVVPATEDQTFFLFNSLTDEYRQLMNTTTGGSALAATALTWQVLKECQGDPLSAGFKENDEKNIQELLVAPAGIMLTKKVRWRINFTSSWDQWVPYIFLIKDSEFNDKKEFLDKEECLTTLSSSHFVWQDIGTFYLNENLQRPEGTKMSVRQTLSSGTYHVVLLAIYWQHDVHLIQEYPTRMLFDFTRDYALKPNGRYKEEYAKSALYWFRRNITSREITFTDKGKAQSKYESIK